MFRLVCFALLLISQPLWGLTQVSQSVYRVALVDKFYPGDHSFTSQEDKELEQALYGLLDLDGDRVKEPYYHGDLVSLIVSHPQIEVLPYRMRQGENPLKELLRNLRIVRRDVFWEEPISAVLIPWESSTLISAFSENLASEQLGSYMKTLLSWASKDEIWRLTWEIILVIEDIIDYGGTVFTIAGNGGPRMVNTYSFAEGVITVGAEETELSHFIADNVFVDLHAKAAYKPQRVDASNGQTLGYDVNGDGCVDIPVQSLSGHSGNLPRNYWKHLSGSSFAAPMALKHYLLGDTVDKVCTETEHVRSAVSLH